MAAWLVSVVLVPVVKIAIFFVRVWIAALRAGRAAALALNDLRYQVTAWARRRGWVVQDGGAYLFTMLAEAERVLVSARGALAGCPCTVLYCTAADSAYVACILRLPRRLPETVADVVTRRHRWALRPASNPAPPGRAERDVAFDRRFKVRSDEPATLAILTSPVRSALLRAAAVAPPRRLRTAGDLVIVEVDGWILWEQLDAVLDVLRAVAVSAGASGHQPSPAPRVHPPGVG